MKTEKSENVYTGESVVTDECVVDVFEYEMHADLLSTVIDYTLSRDCISKSINNIAEQNPHTTI